MPVADFAQHVQAPFFSMIGREPAAARSTAAADTSTADASADSSGTSGKSLFSDFLDIINPLQHIPIVSTIYGAITGDKIGPLEQIAGDTLYGGVTGLVTSIAGEAFTQATGKSIGDTLLALFQGDKSTEIASTAPAATYLVRPADTQTDVASATPPPSQDNDALMASLKRNGADADLALRASYAYRQSVSMVQAAAP